MRLGPTEKWLASLNVKDRVVVVRGHIGGASYTILTIDKLTNTQIVTNNGARWRRSNGRLVGGDNYDYIEPLTDEIRAEISDRKRRGEAMGIIEATRWRNESTDTIEAVAVVLKKAKKHA